MARKKVENISAENNKKRLDPIVSMILGAALLIGSVIALPISVSDRVNEMNAAEQFADKSYLRRDGEVDSAYNGHAIVTYGTLTYDKEGAVDTVFGVSADSAMLFRISEMAQKKTEEDAVAIIWSEEPDGETSKSFPANTKSNYYTAKAVKLGGYEISADQLLMLETKTALTDLPDVDTRGFKTVNHNGVDYITNSEDLDNPKEGDVRIRYEYLDVDTVTFAGKQRETAIVAHTNFNDVRFFAAFEGELSRADVIKHFRGETAPNIWWLYMIAIAAAVAGGALLFGGFCGKMKYEPKYPSLGKNAAGITKDTVILAHGIVIGVFTFLVTAAICWASVYPIRLVIILAVLFLYLFGLIEDMIKNMPRPKKREAEYVPILIKREDRNDRRK